MYWKSRLNPFCLYLKVPLRIFRMLSKRLNGPRTYNGATTPSSLSSVVAIYLVQMKMSLQMPAVQAGTNTLMAVRAAGRVLLVE